VSQGDSATTAAPADADPDSDAAASLHHWVRSGKSFSGHERKCCFLNLGGSGAPGFADISAISGFDYPDDGRALCLSDWDHDGDVDLWMANRNAPQLRLLRNDAPRAGHFVALRLQGTSANRDAIGARVEVYTSRARTSVADPPLIKTLRAGDGFLSQSSKWLHFGLGDATRIEKVVVRWPGGMPEEFRDLTPDRHYHLVQGARRARPWRRPTPVALTAASQTPAKSTESAQIRLSARPPLPRLSYTVWSEAAGTTIASEASTKTIPFDRPVALNLWSASCKPCLEEWREWTEHAPALNESGLMVFALCVDGLDEPQSVDGNGSKSVIDRLRFPFQSGRASAPLVDKLQIIHNLLFDRHRPLPVPTTVLIDAEGRLAAIYKGRVAARRLADDVRRLNADPIAHRANSTPFPGRWHSPPRDFRPISLANALVERGFVDEAIEYSARLGLEKRPDAKYAKWSARIGNELFRRGQIDAAVARYHEALALDPKLATAHLNLAVALVRRRDLPRAESEFRQAIALDPDYIKARLLLATLLMQTKRPAEAALELQEALRRQPRHPEANLNAARLWLAQNNFEAAKKHLLVAATGDPANPEPHFVLGMAHLQRRQVAEAAASLEHALAIRPDWPVAADQLGWILATESNPQIRNPARAVALAETAAAAEPQNARYLDTLAAAYAAAGRYSDAIATAEKALAMARQAGAKNLAAGIEQRQNQYKERKPITAPK
jgi:Flp pilus assembly protein TadD